MLVVTRFSLWCKRCIQMGRVLSCRSLDRRRVHPLSSAGLPSAPKKRPSAATGLPRAAGGVGDAVFGTATGSGGLGEDVGFGAAAAASRGAGSCLSRWCCGACRCGGCSRLSHPSLSRGSAECPLTAAAQLELSTEMIKALRNGGAHLDFRTREGMTALHRAVRCRNHAALLVSRGSRHGGSPSPLPCVPAPCLLPPCPGPRQGSALPGLKHLPRCCWGAWPMVDAWHR